MVDGKVRLLAILCVITEERYCHISSVLLLCLLPIGYSAVALTDFSREAAKTRRIINAIVCN